MLPVLKGWKVTSVPSSHGFKKSCSKVEVEGVVEFESETSLLICFPGITYY